MGNFPPTMIPLQANWYQSRDAQPILYIIAHDTERPNDNTDSIAYLQRGGDLPDGSDRKVSTHSLIEPNGDIYVMVADEYGANHAGYGTIVHNGTKYCSGCHYNVNDITLGMELEYTKAPNNAPYPEDQLLAAGYWIASKRKKWGNLPILMHRDVDPSRRSDARNLTVADLEVYVTRAQDLMNDYPTPDNPKPYKMLVCQVVYQAPSLTSAFAGDPVILLQNEQVSIGKIENNGWLWLVNGWGFIPPNVAVRI